MKPSPEQPKQPERQAIDTLLRCYGIKPCPDTRESLRQELEKEKEKFLTIERVRHNPFHRDISR